MVNVLRPILFIYADSTSRLHAQDCEFNALPPPPTPTQSGSEGVPEMKESDEDAHASASTSIPPKPLVLACMLCVSLLINGSRMLGLDDVSYHLYEGEITSPARPDSIAYSAKVIFDAVRSRVQIQ